MVILFENIYFLEDNFYVILESNTDQPLPSHHLLNIIFIYYVALRICDDPVFLNKHCKSA
eukprot:c40044_g1_i1 orf=278-457(+)